MMWRIFILFCMSCMMLPLHAQIQQNPLVQYDIPQLEDDNTSIEEQNMLNVFEVTKPSLFKQWLHRIGGAMASRYTVMKHIIRKRVYQVKGWWRGRTSN